MLHFAKDFNVKEQILSIIEYKRIENPIVDLFRSSGEKLQAQKVSYYEKFGVLEDGHLTQEIGDTSSVTFTVNPELAKFLSKGYQISIEDEHFMVESTDTTANTITVKERGYAGTPKSNHANKTVVYVVSKAEADGEVTEDYKKSITKDVVNFLQEFTKSVTLTERAVDLAHKDATSLELDETAIKLDEQSTEMARAFLYSVGKEDPEKGRNTMSGLKDLMSKNGSKIFDAQKDLTDEKLDLLFAELANKGSDVDTIIINNLGRNKVFNKMKNSIFISGNEQGKQTAGGVVKFYMPSTMGGKELRIITSPSCKPTDMFIVDSKKLFFLPNVNKKTGEDKVLRIKNETNVSSAVVAKTIKTVGTIKVQGLGEMAYVANIY